MTERRALYTADATGEDPARALTATLQTTTLLAVDVALTANGLHVNVVRGPVAEVVVVLPGGLPAIGTGQTAGVWQAPGVDEVPHPSSGLHFVPVPGGGWFRTVLDRLGLHGSVTSCVVPPVVHSDAGASF